MPSIYDALPRTFAEAMDYGPRRLGPRDRVVAPNDVEVRLDWRDLRGQWREYVCYTRTHIIVSGPERTMPVPLLRRINRVLPPGWTLRLETQRGYNRQRLVLRYNLNYEVYWEGRATFRPDGSVRAWATGSFLDIADVERYNENTPRRFEPPRRRRRRPRLPLLVRREDTVPVLSTEELAELVERLRDNTTAPFMVPVDPDGPPAPFSVEEWAEPEGVPEFTPGGGAMYDGSTRCQCESCVAAWAHYDAEHPIVSGDPDNM